MTERTLTLAGELRSVREGRLFARDAVLEWGFERLIDDVQLGVSELITNAVRHAQTDLVLTLRLDRRLVVEVRDARPDFHRPAVTYGDPRATSGRGLQLVAAISSDWGVRTVDGGKAIWFSLALPDTGTPDADVYTLDDRRDERSHRGENAARRGESKEMQARAAI